MFPSIRELKAQARAAMHGAVPNAFFITLAFLALTPLLSQLVGQFIPDPLNQFLLASSSGDMERAVSYILAGGGLGLFLSVVLILYSCVMQFGYTVWSLRCLRGQDCGYASLLEGFSMVGRVLLMELLVFLMIFAIILAGTLVMSLLLLFLVGISEILPLPVLILPLILVVFSYVAMVYIVSLRYSLVPYQLAHQPDQGAAAALSLGTRMLRGKLWTLVKLELSFFGWQLGYTLIYWAVGMLVAKFTGATLPTTGAVQDILLAVETMILSSPVAYWSATLVSLPMLVWITSYLSLSRAAFFLALQTQTQSVASPITYTRDGI